MLKGEVLDKGFIEVVDSLGNDLTVVNSARVSFGKRKEKWDKSDERLVRIWQNTNTILHSGIYKFSSISKHQSSL